jgi:hypothetical protein
MPSDGSWIPGAIAGFCSGVIGGLTLEFFKRYMFVPDLRLICKPNGKGFAPIAQVPGPFAKEDGPEINARYVRVAVTNKSPTRSSARSCRAYLTDIKKHHADGSLTDTKFAESLRLRWSHEGPNGDLHSGIDIPNRVTAFFDVFSSQEACTWKKENENERHHGGQRILEVAAQNAREAPELLSVLEFNSSYRFSITVTAEGIDPKQAELDVRLGKRWDEIEILGLS